MKMRTKLTAVTTVLLSLGGAALASGDHALGAPAWRGPVAGDHEMMRMHGPMMGGAGPVTGMGRGIGMMGGGAPLMGLAMERFDVDNDGTVTSDEAQEGLLALLAEYDADGDETLSLSEFETLHSALIREAMVDSFQFLDDDGDGAVTMDEVVKPADMMRRMQSIREFMMPSGMIAGPNGGMMGTPGEGPVGNQ